MEQSASLALRPIGSLLTPYATIADCPRNGRQRVPAPLCHAVLAPGYEAGLQAIGGFSHLILLYWLGGADGEPQRVAPSLIVRPPFDGEPRGVFATRSPQRPNPIGLSVVRLERIDGLGRLAVRYLDCVNGTPLLDIKPYLPTTDAEPDAAVGWLAPHVSRPPGGAPA